MEERKNGMVPEEEGPPPIEFMYRGIPNLRCADLPAGGVMEADVVVVGCGGAGIAAAVSAFRSHIDDIIRCLDHIQIMFDDNYRIASVRKPPQDFY